MFSFKLLSVSLNLRVVQDGVCSQSVQSSTGKPTILEGYLSGSLITVATAPYIHAFNVNAAIALKHRVGMSEAFRLAYLGEGSHPPRHVLNPFRGISAHFAKEGVRMIGKTGALVFLYPKLQECSPSMAPVWFSASLSSYEMLINGTDVARTKWALGKPLHLKDLSKGALGNGGRQFVTWLGFMQTKELVEPILKEHEINPKSALGVGVLGVLGGTASTVLAYPSEILLRRLQIGELPSPRSPMETVRFVQQVAVGKASVRDSVYFQQGSKVGEESMAQLSEKYSLFQLIRAVVGGKGFASKLAGNWMLAIGAVLIPNLADTIHTYLHEE